MGSAARDEKGTNGPSVLSLRIADTWSKKSLISGMNRTTIAENFVGELLIKRLHDFGITADSAEVQTLTTELSAKQAELEWAKPRVPAVPKTAVAPLLAA